MSDNSQETTPQVTREPKLVALSYTMVRSASPGDDPDKPKLVRQVEVTIRGKEKFVLNGDLWDDYDVLEAAERGQATILIERLFGDDYDRLKEAMRDPGTGRISAKAMLALNDELLKQLRPTATS